MFSQTAAIDRAGRLTLPQQALDALGVGGESEVLVEVTPSGVLLTPKHRETPVTDLIAAMSLPVTDREQMEREGREVASKGV